MNKFHSRVRFASLAAGLALSGTVHASAQDAPPDAGEVAGKDRTTLLGEKAAADRDDGTAIGAAAHAAGTGASAFGSNATGSADFATAVGYAAAAQGEGSVVVGAAIARGSESIAVGYASFANDANATALGAGANAFGAGALAVGRGANTNADYATAAGYGAVATGADSAAFGANALATAANSVALGAGARAERANTVSVGRAGAERQITDVAAGTQASDAVNLGQLQSVLGSQVGSISVGFGDLQQRIAELDRRLNSSGGGNADTQVQEALSTARNYADAGDRQTLAQSKAYTDQKLGGLASRGDLDTLRQRVNEQLHTLDTRIDRVGAIGAAMSLMAASTQGFGGSSLGVAVGGYRTQGALSIGFSRQISSRARLTFGTAIAGGGETAGGVGLGVGL